MNNNVVNINTNEVGELKGLLTQPRMSGKRRAILDIPVSLFKIDPAYQIERRTERDLRYFCY